MDYVNGLSRDARYHSIPGSQGSEFELHNTEYASPQPIYSTPETAYGFRDLRDDEPLRGRPERQHSERQYSDTSTSTAQGGLLRTMRSRLSSLRDPDFIAERFGKSKGKPQEFKQWFFFWTGILVCVAWCVPAIVLLVLNFESYIVGASAWCPERYCPGIAVGINTSLSSLLAKADHDTHNFVGTLQFVAKALEVWFGYIAVTLVYAITSLLARNEHGLPIGYLLTYVEFTDILSIFKPAHWTSAHLVDNKDPYKESRRVRKFYLFAFGVAFLCILANLIGPGIAVLLIPTVQIIYTDPTYPQRFTTLSSASAPQGPNAIPWCTAEQLAANGYTCTESTYDTNLDSMVNYIYSQLQQDFLAHGKVWNGVAPPTQEEALVFQFNVTALNPHNASVYTAWAPSRQTVRDLSRDQEWYFDNGTNADSEYAGLSNSMTLNLQREGPIVSVTQTLWGGNLTVTQVDDQRAIHCYHKWWWIAETDQYYAKCFRAGSGWNSTGGIAEFQVGTVNSGWLLDWGPPRPAQARSFFADNATYILDDWSTGNLKSQPCFPNGTLPSDAGCDYDSIFKAPLPSLLPQNLTSWTSNAFIIENVLMNDTSLAFVAESYLTLGFTTYGVEVTNATYSSEFGVVQISDLPDMTQTSPIALNASWYLGVWSCNNTNDVSMFRYSAWALQTSIADLYDQVNTNGSIDWSGIDFSNWSQLSLYTVLQAASLIPYNVTDPATDGINLSPDDMYHPSLAKNAMRQVYAYGIDSRTSILGVVTTIMGIIVALGRAGLSFVTRVRHREPLELLVAAMKHPHMSEFEGCGESERKMAKVRFRIDDSREDKIIFSKK